MSAVWLGVSAAAASAAWSLPAAWHEAGQGSTAADRTADVVVAGCATALAAALAWLWVVTSVTVAALARGSVPTGGGAVRRLVLAACGVAVVAGGALPAQAAAGDGAEVLAGLRLPERAVTPAVVARSGAHRAAPAATSRAGRPVGEEDYVVRAGDSLWSIARAHPAPGSDTETRWRAIWHHNRAVVGDDPDLIHPGQALRLPASHPQTDIPTGTDTDTDGERR
ncbi:LysM peptidoglycan-binding domain-containing protein [Nocardioides sp. zg-1228]|nr:LysM peptidoglycan-binding domain-containing protein [Nocardioides sp. zg-1228]